MQSQSSLGRHVNALSIKKTKHLTIPSFVADVEHGGGKGRCAGVLWHGGVVQVAQLGLALSLWVAHVLAQHHIRSGNGGDALQHLHLQWCQRVATLALKLATGTERKNDASAELNDLLVPHVVRVGRGWFLHGDQAEHLQQMVLHDVPNKPFQVLYTGDILEFVNVHNLQWEPCISPNDPKVIKVSSATLGAKRLLEGENHCGHTGPVPYGSKDTISKPTTQQDYLNCLELHLWPAGCPTRCYLRTIRFWTISLPR